MNKDYIKYQIENKRETSKGKIWLTLAKKYNLEFAQCFTKDTEDVENLFNYVKNLNLNPNQIAELYNIYMQSEFIRTIKNLHNKIEKNK